MFLSSLNKSTPTVAQKGEKSKNVEKKVGKPLKAFFLSFWVSGKVPKKTQNSWV